MTMSKEPLQLEKPVTPKMKCQGNCDKCQKEKEKKTTLKKAVVLSAMLVFNALSSFAADQASAVKTFWDDPFNDPMLPVYAVTTLLLIAIILVVVVSFYVLKVLKLFIHKAEEERAARLGIAIKREPSWWDKLWQSANDFVPLEEEKNIELDHNFDGIKELDNHLPPWWKMLFYGCIIWGVFYLLAYHVFYSLPLSESEYQNELTLAEEKARIFRASQPAEVIDENTLTYAKDDAILAKGKTIFTGNCVACHKADGGGNTIGPNLTDDYWIHGGNVKDVFKTIKNGVVEKGMPVWGKAMSPQDVKAVTFYVMSLKGSNPKDAKAPQGELFKEVVEQTTADSLKIQASLVNK